MNAKSGMKRRTRITLALAALTTFAFGVTYGLVAQQGVPQTAATTAVASQSVSQSSSAPAQSSVAPSKSNSSAAPSNSARSQRAAAPPVVHSRTRAT